MLEFLSHLERRGFTGSPRPVGSGFDPDGHELLTYVEAQSPQPWPWTDEAIVHLGELLGHDIGAQEQWPSGWFCG